MTARITDRRIARAKAVALELATQLALPVAGVEVTADGTVRILTAKAAPSDPVEEWFRAHDTRQADRH